MNRRGSALLAALVVMVALALLGAGALDLANRRLEAGRRAEAGTRARALGRAAASLARERLRPESVIAIAPGQSRLLDSAFRGGAVIVDSLLRLSPGLAQVYGVAAVSRPGYGIVARDATRELVELIDVGVADSGAVIAAGPVTLLDRAEVRGDDPSPGVDPSCPGGGGPGTGVLAGPAAVTWVDSTAGAGVSGSPSLAADSVVTGAMLDRLSPSPLAVLAGAADLRPLGSPITPGATVSGAACDTLDPFNWGDPTGAIGPCAGFRPLTLLPSGASVRGGAGQGVLLAPGPLVLEGGFRFRGIILARGPVVMRDSASLVGILVGADSLTLRDSARISRSPCAVRAARAATRRIRRLSDRGWSTGP